jgi:hypothetical protein
MKKLGSMFLSLLICGLFCAPPARAQSGTNDLANLTIYNAGIGEFLEEREVELQTGLNSLEWRSLMPKAYIRTVRVVAADAEVVRQDVTYDGAQVNNERSPVLHLVIQNRGAAGRRKVQVDYLAPGISWKSDYALVLEPTASGAAPTAATLDSWVTLYNNTGADLLAGKVDLVAGEISLLTDEGSSGYQYTTQSQNYSSNVLVDGTNAEQSEVSYAEVTTLSAFNRFALGDNLSLNANAIINRFPIFQRARLVIVQRNVFENSHDTQTLGRGGFILQPRGLEVRLVAKNTASAPLAAGLVTIYQRSGAGLAQIVGQDRIAFTPQGGEFSVTQGRSATLFGTRRVLERRVVNYRDKNNESQDKLVTRVEVILSNRGALAAEAFVRESIERYDDNMWKITDSSPANGERLGANTVQFKVSVPAGGKTTIVYTVENE